jgi:tocopherol O-methyltransferase
MVQSGDGEADAERHPIALIYSLSIIKNHREKSPKPLGVSPMGKPGSMQSVKPGRARVDIRFLVYTIGTHQRFARNLYPTGFSVPRTNEKSKIVDHYDRVSPYYHSLWGEHLHHGYWIRGDESKETAQLQLIEHLARLADVRPGADILDIGCGFGASSLFLARKFGATATGITISPVQVEMANRAATAAGARAKFLLMDAEALRFDKQFDLLWSVESISHYQDIAQFFRAAATYLKPGGAFALTDWFKGENLSPAEYDEFIAPIDKGMFVELHTMDNYARYLESSGLEIVYRENLTSSCAKTWDVGLDIIKEKSFWSLALEWGPEFLTYLKAFRAVRSALDRGAFVYGLFVARKPEPS